MSKQEELENLITNDYNDCEEEEEPAAPVIQEVPLPTSVYSNNIFPQTENTQEPVLTYQPQRYQLNPNLSHSDVDQVYLLSIICAILCCLCGSPITLVFLVPAIIYASKVRDHLARGDYQTARNSYTTAWTLVGVGIVAGIIIIVLVVILYFLSA